MCDVVMDFGDDVEMRALFENQRIWHVRAFTMAAVFLTSTAIWLNLTKVVDLEAVLVLVIAADLLAILAVIQAKTITYADWMKTMPQRDHGV